jgi:deoxyribodipyrimidine photo-lyase
VTTSIAWFRRDLRLQDNPAWSEATGADEVCALFVIDPDLFDVVLPRRRAVLLAGLEDLDRSLSELGGRLRVERGDPREVVPRVAGELGVEAVHVNREITPYGVERDRAIMESVDLEQADGLYIQPPGSVRTEEGTIYQVFSPFHRTWQEMPMRRDPDPDETSVLSETGSGIPDRADADVVGGESDALDRLAEFDDDVGDYHEVRDRPDLDQTSRLSIALKYGFVSPKRVYREMDGRSKGRQAFNRQLAWREFYAHLLYDNPEMPTRPLREKYSTMEWRDAPDELEAWKEGMTGYPLVDAGMRQLKEEGWLHNRVRLVVASFLVKDLLIDWTEGERHFRRHLLDADVAQNSGNWQWVAGVGADAAPYFRVFNPVTQSKKFDPKGEYIKRWVPELEALPENMIHAPWEAGLLDLAEHDVTLGENYPDPLVDHKEARERAIATYESVA